MAGMGALSVEGENDQFQEEYLKTFAKIEKGSLIKGTVIQIDNEFVFLDLGLKSDGKVPLSEFYEAPVLNEIVQVVLIQQEGRDGNVVISKKKADLKILWVNLKSSFQEHKPIAGKVMVTVKGGFRVSLGASLEAFCPMSKMHTKRVEDSDDYIGKELLFHIDKLYNDKRVNIVLNRRAYMEELSEQKRNEFFETALVGDEVDGIVKSFISFGAFVDIGGFDGLLHVNDMSWGHVNRPKDYVKKNQKLKLKIIRLDHNQKKINLSLKHFQDDPWSSFEGKYHVNQIIKGVVTRITDFGAFIQIEEGIEGLAHISELSWVKHIEHPQELLKVGDECEAMILGYDIPQSRISLGVKQVFPNPWDKIQEAYPEGFQGTWRVTKVTNSGAFIKLEEGLEAFIHSDNLSWTKRIRNPSHVLEEGQEIKAVILEVNLEKRRISAGVKQLLINPWIDLEIKYKKGSIIQGEVCSKTDFGIFLKVEGDIEGLIHKTNLVTSKDEDPDAKLKKINIGDSVKAVVSELNKDKQKLSLSLRDLKYQEEREEISKYMESDSSEGSAATLADFIESKKE